MPKRTIQQIAAAVASMIREKPRKLARAVTYVGGSVPGARAAIGSWDGGTERASVVSLPAENAPALALAIARRNNQKTALWFTPGEGPDSLHVLQARERPEAVRSALQKHGVTYMTLLPSPGGTTVHVVDPGGELTGPLQAFARDTGATLRTQVGKAGFAPVEEKKPAS